MGSFKAFIKEVLSLDIRIIELQTEQETINGITYTKVLPLWYLDPKGYKPEEKERLVEYGCQFIKCWDLSHYFNSRDQNIWESSYSQRLNEITQEALTEITTKEHADLLLNQVNQQITRFKDFKKRWKENGMYDIAYNERNSWHLSCYQEDIKIYYLSLFNTAGASKKEGGHSPHFLWMLKDIYECKLSALFGMQAHLSALAGKKIKRLDAEYEFNGEEGWERIKGKEQPEAKAGKKAKAGYSLRQVAIAYKVMNILITKDNAGSILEKHTIYKSSEKLLQKRITGTGGLTKISENKTTDTKALKDLEAAKRLITGMKNKNGITGINRIIVAFTTTYNNHYQ